MISLSSGTLSFAVATSLLAAIPTLAAPSPSVYVAADGIVHFCYMETASGEVIPLDEMCGGGRDDYESSPPPVSANRYVRLYNDYFCDLLTQDELRARGDATVINASTQERIQANHALIKARSGYEGDFREEILPYVFKSLSDCP